MHSPREKTLVDGLLVGLGVGFAVVALVIVLGVVFGRAAVTGSYEKARKGWTLAPTLVANLDLKRGTPLTISNISQREFPTQFMTANSVRPADAARLLGRPLLFDVQAGDPLRWSDVEPAFPPVRVLVAARDLDAGTRLSSADVEERVLSSELAGESWVHASDTATALGRVTSVPTLKGDPLLWSQLPAAAIK